MEKMVIENRKTKTNASMIFGCVVIGAIFVFAWLFSYINEPVGDDVLCYYDGAPTFYLDEFESDLGSKITSFPQIFKLLGFVYTHWSGRMPGYFINYVGKMLPKVIQALLTAAVFVANILLAMRIVYKKWSETLSKPIVFGVLFLALYWYRYAVFYTYMWTMVTICSFAVLFCLLYINMAVVDYERGERHSIWILLIVGFVAGFSHEVLSFCTITIVGLKWIIDVIREKESWREIFRHFGLGLGYLFCFFAPGNFYRQAQSHDAISATYIDRLKTGWDIHKYVLESNATGKCIFFVAAILAYTGLVLLIERRNKEAIKETFIDIAPYFGGGVSSVLVWGYASYVAPYGLDLWILIVYIILLRMTKEISADRNTIDKRQPVWVVCTIVIMLLFVKSNVREVYHYSRVSIERRNLARSAVQEGQSEVAVPYFDSDLSTDRYLLSYLNDQNQYNTNYYIAYYGTRLVLSVQE